MSEKPAPPLQIPPAKPEHKPAEQAQDEIKSTEHAPETHTHRVAGRSGGVGG